MGKTWTTSVRRFTSRWIRSSGFVDRIFFFPCRSGKTAKAVRSSFASSSIALTFGNCVPSMSATVSSAHLSVLRAPRSLPSPIVMTR